MKLKGFPLTDIKYCMQVAEVQGRANEPVKIKLFIKNGENLEAVKRDLAENYKARNIDSYEILSKKGEDILTFADIPAKNLRKAVEEKYVRKYGWPEELETLEAKRQPYRESLAWPRVIAPID